LKNYYTKTDSKIKKPDTKKHLKRAKRMEEIKDSSYSSSDSDDAKIMKRFLKEKKSKNRMISVLQEALKEKIETAKDEIVMD
jgi:hypothetical protein